MSFSVDDALRLLCTKKILSLVAQPPFHSLVAEIAGGPVRGSWWGHPASHAIFEVATALEEHADVCTAKVAAGKVAFVHRDLWAPLLRVITDAGFRRRAATGLDDAARALLTRVRRAGELRLDDAADRKARVPLDERLLVHTAQEHNPSGKHLPVLRTWERWAPPGAMDAAAALDLDAARATLAAVGVVLGTGGRRR